VKQILKIDENKRENGVNLMARRAILILVFLLCSASIAADEIKIDTKDYLTFIVSSYVSGFKEFDTSVTTGERLVSVGVYYDEDNQKRERAEQLAERFRAQIPHFLSRYEWAKETEVRVNVYGQ
jgi:hypothetical protein